MVVRMSWSLPATSGMTVADPASTRISGTGVCMMHPRDIPIAPWQRGTAGLRSIGGDSRRPVRGLGVAAGALGEARGCPARGERKENTSGLGYVTGRAFTVAGSTPQWQHHAAQGGSDACRSMIRKSPS
jgi:hypothetical protein